MREYKRITLQFTPKKLINTLYESGKTIHDLYRVGVRYENIIPRDYKGGLLNLKEDIKKSLREPMLEKLSERISLVMNVPKSIVKACFLHDDFDILTSIDDL